MTRVRILSAFTAGYMRIWQCLHETDSRDMVRLRMSLVSPLFRFCIIVHPKGVCSSFQEHALAQMKTCKRTISPGDQFGKLTVIRQVDDNSWLCRCECGKNKVLSYKSLVYQNVRSCGCLRGRKESLTVKPGMRFGKLTILRKGERINRNLVWICQCDCGNIKGIYQSNLQNGKTRSCGCSQYVRMIPASEDDDEMDDEEVSLSSLFFVMDR